MGHTVCVKDADSHRRTAVSKIGKATETSAAWARSESRRAAVPGAHAALFKR